MGEDWSGMAEIKYIYLLIHFIRSYTYTSLGCSPSQYGLVVIPIAIATW